MNKLLSSRPTAIQGLLVVAISVATSAVLYSDWFKNCCMDGIGLILGIFTLPAMLIGLLLAGGNVHGGSQWHFYVGIAVQFYFLFWLVKWVTKRWQSSR
jgi:hypothetical protein